MIRSLLNKYSFLRNPVRFCRKIGVKIGNNCIILGSHHPFGTEPYMITIGDHVRINEGVQFITHDGSVWVIRYMTDYFHDAELKDIDLFGTIVVGNNVQIGSRALIMPGVKIGSNVIVGAGAIVTKDVPDNSIVAGVPAKVIETIDEYYNKHKNHFDHTKNMTYQSKKSYLIDKYL